MREDADAIFTFTSYNLYQIIMKWKEKEEKERKNDKDTVIRKRKR